MAIQTLLSGSEYVLVAQVPKGSTRWQQAHFNRQITEDFFRLRPGDERTVTLERVAYDGYMDDRVTRKLVYSAVNKNCKIEFDFSPIYEYPAEGVPLLVVVELGTRSFRYRPTVPGMPGYREMLQLNLDTPAMGRGHRRVLTSLDEVEMRWPNSFLRNPRGIGRSVDVAFPPSDVEVDVPTPITHET